MPAGHRVHPVHPSIRAAGVVLALAAPVALSACSPDPVSTTKLSVTSPPANGSVTTSSVRATGTRSTAVTSSDPAGSERRPVLSLGAPAGWQAMTAAELGQAWVGVDAPGLRADGYQPNVVASALSTDQRYEDITAKPVMCQEPTAFAGVTDFVVLGHKLQRFREVDSCVSEAEYTTESGGRVHELNVVFATGVRDGKAALVQLAGRTSRAAWPKLGPAVRQIMEGLQVTP